MIDGDHYNFHFWYIDDLSITEVCLPKELPYSEDFATSPKCWTQTYSGGITSDRWSHFPTNYAGGANGEMGGESVNNVGVSRLISPLIRFDNVDMASLSFKHDYDNYYNFAGVTIKLQCSPDLVNWTDLPFSHSGSDIAVTTQTVQFVPMADSLYFAWVIDGNHYNFLFWFIDDVSIIEIASCLKPTHLAISNISSTGATATWTAGGSETSWQIEYKTAAANTWITQVVNTPTYTMTGLQPSTAYQVRVKSLCGSGLESTYTTVVSFTTGAPCFAEELPFFENFSTYPNCWTQTHFGGITPDTWSYSSTTHAGGATGEMMGEGQQYYGESRLISPLIRFDNVEAARLSFKHHYDGWNLDIVIKLQCSPDLVNWTDLPFSYSGGDIAATTQTVQFVPMADSLYIAWVIDGNHDDFNYWFIDDVSITEVCLPKVLPYSEDFTTSPHCWTQTHSGGVTSDRWTHSMTPNAGGTTGEMRAQWVSGVGVSRLISPLIRFDNDEMARLSFKHDYDNEGSNVTIKLQCSPDLVTWTDLPFSHSGSDIAATTQTVQFVPMADSLYFAWVIDGNHYRFNNWYIDDVFITEIPPCVQPTNLAISNISSTGATATWTAGGSETSWQIEYKAASSGTWTTQTVNNPTYNMTGLQPTTAYQVRVKSLCGSGSESAYTTVVSFTTAAPLCVVPTNLAISNVSSTGATATWTAGGSETSWQIEYKTTTATTWIIQTVTTPTYTMIGLQPSTDYQVKVKSLCGIGVESDYTTVVSFTTAASPCVVPTNLAISSISSTGATATWTAGGSETSWQIEYKTATGGTWTTQTVNNPTYTMTGLQPSTDYQTRVRSLCDNGEESDYTSVVSFTTAAPPCVVPTNLAISSISSTGATATWTAGGSETSWEFEYRLIGAADWTTQTVTTPTYSMTGLQPSTAYEVRVKSLCDDGEESAYTEPVSFTTDAIPTYTITATAGSNGTITPSGTVTVNEGASQTFIFTPNEGYQINTVIVDNQPIEPIPTSYTFENVQADHTIHVDFTVGIDENELSRYVTLYPNPTQSYIDLKLDKDYLIATECRIYDMYGKLMRILPIEEEITTIDVSDFAVGVYFVRLTTEQGQISKRFVKQ